MSNDSDYKSFRDIMKITEVIPVRDGSLFILFNKIASEFDRMNAEIENLRIYIRKVEDKAMDYDD